MGKNKLPWDVKQTCLWIVRGHDRRVKWYNEQRQDIIHGQSAKFDTYIAAVSGKGEERRVYTPRSREPGRTAEQKALQLEGLEKFPEVNRIRAVEFAERNVGGDIVSDELRRRLLNGLRLNCAGGRKYPFEFLNLSEFSQRDFYRRKDKFLYDIARYLDMV